MLETEKSDVRRDSLSLASTPASPYGSLHCEQMLVPPVERVNTCHAGRRFREGIDFGHWRHPDARRASPSEYNPFPLYTCPCGQRFCDRPGNRLSRHTLVCATLECPEPKGNP